MSWLYQPWHHMFTNHENMHIFRSSQFHNCESQNHINPEHHEVSTTMSQNHEITKLHIFQCHSWNNYDTLQSQIQIVDGNLTNNVKCTKLTATSLSMSHDCNYDCNNYKLISHQIGQYQPRIFAPPFEMNEDGSTPDS